jgi:3'-phosphoadenosine 5'-phosphosulfate sulfotransferase (PAPS reductase)/FAD synthetase
MNATYILSVSGGKDSTALLLWAMEQGIDFQPVFADTGNEHSITLDYVRDLPRQTGCPEIQWVKADFSADFVGRRKKLPEKWRRDGVPEDRIQAALVVMLPTGNPFLDMCLLKGRFPSTRARFCSEELKFKAVHEEIIIPLLDEGFETISMLGIRADESRARANMLRLEDLEDGRWIYRPILDWTVEEVFAIHHRHNVEPNPLYKLGCARVGCMPCIHETKGNIRNLSKRFPNELDRIAQWEEKVKAASKRCGATFFPADKIPGPHQKDHSLPVPAMKEVIRWSMTAWGGRQLDPLAGEEPAICSSQYGLCE